MTPHAIHGRTGIPIDIIEAGLNHLSQPDPYSRSSSEEGRRIVLLDDHRNWGWLLVNHGYYNALRSAEDKREADRERLRSKRAANSGWVGGPITGEKCAYCGVDATGVDHIIATDNGGPDHDSNLVPCCQRCNSSKHLRRLHDFLNDSTTQIDVKMVMSNKKLTKLVGYINGRFVAVCRDLSHDIALVAPVSVSVSVPTDKSTTDASRPLNQYPQEFESAWSMYPNRTGSNPKLRAFKQWCARVKAGEAIATMTDGVKRYARFCEATGKLHTEYVMQAATFFGPDKNYENTWTPPTGGNSAARSHIDSSAPARVARAADAQRTR